jgi:ATP-dependent exoDNAse (exonuclease V) alpha subunit
VLTRQLFYTGLTRARKSVRILAPEAILRATIATRSVCNVRLIPAG